MSLLRSFRFFGDTNNFLNGGILKSKNLRICKFCQNTDIQEANNKFFNEDVQKILMNLTNIDYKTIFRPNKLGQKISKPELKFMTDEELEEARTAAKAKATRKLQMPPVLSPRKEINKVYIVDKKLLGYSRSKFFFTDISFGKNDQNRLIATRDIDGTLRNATWEERQRLNEIYFPKEGRKLKTPKMFHPEFFEEVLSKEWYEFILNRACIQFEPDDPQYINITQTTYNKVAENSKFKDLESTRHFGSLVYYLVQTENLSTLLIYYLNSDRLNNILDVIKLHKIIHPEKFCSSFTSGDEVSLVKAFINELYADNSDLILSWKTFKDYYSKPKIAEA